MTPPIHEMSDSGATAAEYAILVSLIAVVIIVAVTTLGESVRDNLFQYTVDALKAVL